MTNFIHENPLGDIELNTVTENVKDVTLHLQ